MGRLGRVEAREARPDVRVQNGDADTAAAFDTCRRRRHRERQQQKGEEPEQPVHGNALEILDLRGLRLLGPACSLALRCCGVLEGSAQELLMPGNDVRDSLPGAAEVGAWRSYHL